MVGLWLGFTLMTMHPRPRRPFDHHAVCEVWEGRSAGGLLGRKIWQSETQMGVSENSVPLNPMVNDHYPY